MKIWWVTMKIWWVYALFYEFLTMKFIKFHHNFVSLQKKPIN